MHISEFQFEDSGDLGDTDRQWLRVTLQVSSPDAAWDWTDPCLEFREAKSLVTWLADIAEGNPVRSHIGYFRRREHTTEDPLVTEDAHIMFLEPEVSFDLVGRDEGTTTLRVCLYDVVDPDSRKGKQEFRRQWTRTERPMTVPAGTDCLVSVVCRDFTVTADDLLEASRSLIADLRRLPPREGLSVDDTGAQTHG